MHQDNENRDNNNNTETPVIQKVIAVLWPSFLTSGAASILFFAYFDPQLLMQVSGYGAISRMGGYTTGFFLFWLLTSLTCVMMCYFQRPCEKK